MSYAEFLDDALARLNFLSEQRYPEDLDTLGRVFQSPHLLRHGVWCEFGVAAGASLKRLAAERGKACLWGFDVFTGLPKDWLPRFPKGAFKQESIPLVEGVHIVTGLFSETLPYWNPSNYGFVTLAHIDCDLYEGAVQALRKILPLVTAGSIIVLDEVWNVEDFEKNEMLALYDALQSYEALGFLSLEWDWLYASKSRQSAAILIK